MLRCFPFLHQLVIYMLHLPDVNPQVENNYETAHPPFFKPQVTLFLIFFAVAPDRIGVPDTHGVFRTVFKDS